MPSVALIVPFAEIARDQTGNRIAVNSATLRQQSGALLFQRFAVPHVDLGEQTFLAAE